MSVELGSGNIENVVTGNRTTTSEVKGERSDHCAIEAFVAYNLHDEGTIQQRVEYNESCLKKSPNKIK
jgi:hypothetical protein